MGETNAYYIAKAKIKLRSFTGGTIVDDEYTLIAPMHLENEFLTMLLAKRFMQLRSLFETAPWNVLHKLISYNYGELDFNIVDGKFIVNESKNENVPIYKWITNSGNEILLVLWDHSKLLVLFETVNKKKYCVIIHKKFILS